MSRFKANLKSNTWEEFLFGRKEMSDNRVYLRGVDLVSLVVEYLNGKFANLNSATPVNLIDVKTREDIVLSKENVKDSSYQLDLGSGINFLCIGYKIYDNNGNYGPLDANKEYNCMYCLKQIKSNPIGIPIRREERNNKLYFHMIDVFCWFRCAAAELKKRESNTIYSNSRVYLSEIYNKCTGKDISTLKEAPDQRYLQIFNGHMTLEEFHSNTNTYSEKPSNMYFVPVLEYLEKS